MHTQALSQVKKTNQSSLQYGKTINTKPKKANGRNPDLQTLYDHTSKPHRSNPNALQASYNGIRKPHRSKPNRMTSIADEHCPCDTCESAYLCVDIKMACVDFNRYLSDGKFHNKDRQLSREMYIKIYPTDPLSRAGQM